jgi:3'-5' exoribonuclease
MKSPYVNEIEPDRVITTNFLVHHKEIRQKKTGDPYLSLMLGDRTGELDAKMWDNVAEIMETFDRGDFVKVKGLIQIFHNRPQLTIHKLRRVAESEIDFADFFPASQRDPAEMWTELRAIAAAMHHPHLKGLIEALLDDPEIARRYRTAPAAKQIHHAWLGGLIEHVLSLCGLAKQVAAHYRFIDYDLLLTGVVLHDIGKIYELNYERGFSYSSEGQLLGHMVIALRMVADKLRGLPEFPVRLRALVEHMIISHHGQLEFGSPKVPQFPEALLLHYLDDMDSKMECMRSTLEKDSHVEGFFTGYNAALDRTVLKKDKFLDPPPPTPPPPRAPVVAPPVVAPPAVAPPVVTSSVVAPPVAAPPAVGPPVVAPPVEAPPVVAPPQAVQHPLFVNGPKPSSAFGDKLMQALQPAETKPEV